MDDMQKQCVNAQNSIDQQVQQIRNEIEVLCSRIEGINNDIDVYTTTIVVTKNTATAAIARFINFPVAPFISL